jgi:DNA-binding beta-propeller fold protein YncE
VPSIRPTDLIAKLKLQTHQELDRADANRDGVLSSAEETRLPAYLRQEVAFFRSHVPTVRVDQFTAQLESWAKQVVPPADGDKNGWLSTTEQGKLPAFIRDNVEALWSTPTTPAPPTSSTGPFGIAGTVPASRVKLTPVLTQGLNHPTGVAFNPHDGKLWVVNRGDSSSVVIEKPGTTGMKAYKYRDQSAHFMQKPVALAFSPTRNELATVQDTNNDYGGQAPGNNFMGPTLWTANLNHYNGSTDSHLDMLHHSPFAMGIAAGAKKPLSSDKREYWVFNGQAGSIDRYFFNQPHGDQPLGGHDHSDGETFRYAPGSLKRVPGVPSNLVYDEASRTLFIADTGNGRIARLDAGGSLTGTTALSTAHGETPLRQVPGAKIETLVGPSSGLQRPSGMAMKDGQLVVADHATGKIHVFTQQGVKKGEVDTGLGPSALTGITAGPDGKLYVLDAKRGQLVTLQIT